MCVLTSCQAVSAHSYAIGRCGDYSLPPKVWACWSWQGLEAQHDGLSPSQRVGHKDRSDGQTRDLTGVPTGRDSGRLRFATWLGQTANTLCSERGKILQ